MVITGTSQPFISVVRNDMTSYLKKSSQYFNHECALNKSFFDSWQLCICLGGSEHFNPIIKRINQVDCVICLSCSYDGSLFVTGSADSLIRLFDANTFDQLLLLSGHIGCVYSVDISYDNAKLVSGGEDSFIYVWNVLSGSKLFGIKSLTGREVFAGGR